MKLREIKHCRLAMVGFFFMVLRNASTGEGPSLLPNLTTAEFQSSVGDFIPRDIRVHRRWATSTKVGAEVFHSLGSCSSEANMSSLRQGIRFKQAARTSASVR